ncbi:hypothetical protein GCM10010387_48100 [Streptomyces inusitatus]|uniref:Terpene synthase n=1 Tax=Streptomyces inusitatus TaxID=68221 RepID=A0A918QIN0_9ACTN|nr:terpene synthase family protein [Streptomyces inusitatus]GGZ48256.1 hypothetical protein GCM10010387_48100 [Streptomyces inusitatus]
MSRAPALVRQPLPGAPGAAHRPRVPSPGRAADGDRHTGWLARHRLLAEGESALYRSYALPELIRLSYPGAPAAERELLTDLLGWYTVLDDRFDGPLGRDPALAGALVRRLTDVMDAPARVRPARGVVTAWSELWQRQCRGRTTVWRRRSARDWADCLGTFVAETAHRSRGSLPSVAEATLLRRHASCLYPFMNMLERVEGAELPGRLRARPAWHRLRSHTADAATLVNDLCSLAREEERDSGFNMVLVLSHEHGLSRDQALSAVRNRVRVLRRESEVLRGRLAREHPGSRRYLEGTRELVDGVCAWSGSTARYRGPKSQLPGVSVASLV